MRGTFGLITMTALMACGGRERGGGGGYVGRAQKMVEHVTITIDRPIAAVGEVARATAMATYAAGSSTDLTATASWSSSDPAVATVERGMITAVAPGQAIITATVGGKSGSATLTVSAGGATLIGVAIDPGPLAIDVGESVTFVLMAEYDSGDRIDVSAQAVWTAAGGVTMNGPVATGVSAGIATIQVSFQGASDEASLTVRTPVTIVALEVSPSSLALAPGGSAQLVATAIGSDGSRQILGTATWRTSNASIATVATSGSVSGVAAGQATITAAFGGLEGTSSVVVSSVSCQYPSAGSQIHSNQALPSMSWSGAFDAFGASRSFSASSFFCDPAYDAYSSVHFILSAGWCPNCPSYLADVASRSAQIEAAGGLIVYVEVEDDNYAPATHAEARQSIDAIIGSSPGLRIGDGQTMPTPMTFAAAITAFPSAFVVRKSDMKVIASQSESQYVLDFVALAQEAAGGVVSACAPGTEESFEPNDQASQAGAIAAGAVVDGGLCDGNDDFYQVTHAGAWRLDLLFTHSVGDLDVYVYDPVTMMPARDASGNVIGSDGTVSNESFSHAGAATIMVVGYQGATAPYQLRLTGL
jgi:uncharacterized protein YjdB